MGDLADGLRHLCDGGGDQIGLCLLPLQVVGDGLGVVQIPLGGAQDPGAGLLGAGQHGVELGLVHPHGELDSGEVVDPACVEQLHQRIVEAVAGQLAEPAQPTRLGLDEQGRAGQRQGGPHQLPAQLVAITEPEHGHQAEQQAEVEQQAVGEGGQAQGQGGLAFPQLGIDPFRPLLQRLVRRGAHRLILHRLAAGVLNGGDEGADPVVVAILAAVLDRSHPALVLAQMRPHVGEGLGRHVGMAHQVVRRPLQFLQSKAGDLAELLVGIRDPALQIRGGDQVLVLRVETLTLGNGMVDSHGMFRLGLVAMSPVCKPCTRVAVGVKIAIWAGFVRGKPAAR
ncbi:hypothetical protein D3C80_1233220 [compost metagenome]